MATVTMLYCLRSRGEPGNFSFRRSFSGVVPLLLIMIAGCTSKSLLPAVSAPTLPAQFVATHMAVLHCTDLAPVGLQLNDKAVRIEAPQAPRDLAQVDSEAGPVFEADGYRLAFNNDGAIYTQSGNDNVAIDCRVFPVKSPWESARLREVSFRAVGRPGWILEVVPDKWILLLTNDGQDRVIVPPGAAVKEGSNMRFHVEADTHVFDMLTIPVTCSDGVGDEIFDTQVKITYDGVTFNGCGRWLVQP